MSELSAAKTAWEAPAHDTEDDTADSIKLARAFTYIAEMEAALAERDRMLRLAWGRTFWLHNDKQPTLDDWLIDLRARAEEGNAP